MYPTTPIFIYKFQLILFLNKSYKNHRINSYSRKVIDPRPKVTILLIIAKGIIQKIEWIENRNIREKF